MSNEMGNLVACATNLGFAVELYLKALLTQLDEPVQIGHDLCALYGRIPQQVRTVIEKVYDLQLPKQARLLNGHMCVTLAKSPLGKPSWDDYKVSRALPDLLARSRDLFQSWRYIFEFTQPEDATYQFHQFEYGFLWCAAEAIRFEIKVRSSGIGKKGMGTL